MLMIGKTPEIETNPCEWPFAMKFQISKQRSLENH